METAIVTGGTSGIGFATAKKLAARGFRVVITGRGEQKCEEVAREIDSNAKGMALDLSSFESIRSFAPRIEGEIALLVNNAGNMSLDPKPVITKDGVELTLATNAVGPFLLTRLLLPRTKKIVNVSSRAHLPKSGYGAEVNWDWDNLKGDKSYEPMTFYKNSKLALMWITYELHRRGVNVNAVCPGFVPATIGEKAGGIRGFMFKHVLPHMPGAHTVEEASDNTIFAATEGKPGVFIGEKKEVKSSEQSYDVAEAKRFWKLACEWTGLPEEL